KSSSLVEIAAFSPWGKYTGTRSWRNGQRKSVEKVASRFTKEPFSGDRNGKRGLTPSSITFRGMRSVLFNQDACCSTRSRIYAVVSDLSAYKPGESRSSRNRLSVHGSPRRW